MIFTLVLKIKCPIKDFFKFKMMAGRCFVVVLFLLLTSSKFPNRLALNAQLRVN